MALPPSGIPDSDGDRKRLMQRADSFAIGSGTRQKKDFEEIEEFDEALGSVMNEVKRPEPETQDEEKQLAEHREEHAQFEAERRGSSSPSHQPFLGLSVLPGINAPRLSVGETPESHSKKRSAGVDSNESSVVESVSREILVGLKQAGLDHPIATLDDPRIKGSAEGLRDSYVMSLSGRERVYVWSRNGCHQILTIGMRETTLESAVGATVETVVRKGRVDQKLTRTRPDPTASFELEDDV